MSDETQTDAAARPATVIRVVRGNPSPEEIAAATAVVAAALEAAASVRDEIAPEPTAWSRSQRSLRTPVYPGAGAWRASAF